MVMMMMLSSYIVRFDHDGRSMCAVCKVSHHPVLDPAGAASDVFRQ